MLLRSANDVITFYGKPLKVPRSAVLGRGSGIPLCHGRWRSSSGRGHWRPAGNGPGPRGCRRRSYRWLAGGGKAAHAGALRSQRRDVLDIAAAHSTAFVHIPFASDFDYYPKMTNSWAVSDG